MNRPQKEVKTQRLYSPRSHRVRNARTSQSIKNIHNDKSRK